MTGLKFMQFGLFLLLLGFTVNIFAYLLFVLAFISAFMGPDGLEFSFKMLAWGGLSLPVGWIIGGIGKLLCAGVPEEKARTLIVASLVCDFGVFGSGYLMTTSPGNALIGLIGIFLCVIISYVTFLQFLGRMGDNVGEPRVTYYVSILLRLMILGGVASISIFFSDSGGVVANACSFIGAILFNYTIFMLYRAMPLYIEEVKAGITDPTESAEDRREQERKERMDGPGGGPAESKPPEEPQGEPPPGHLLYRVPKGLEPLHLAVKEGDRHKVELRLSAGDDPRKPVRHKLSPLHIAASVGVMDVADALLKAGAPIDDLCEMGLTPLFFAVQTGNPNIAGFFLDRGANIFHKNEHGYTPLHWACCAPHPNFVGPVRVKMVNFLISQGADINAKTNDGKTPRDLALENKLEETISLLDRHLGNVPKHAPAISKDSSDGDIVVHEQAPAAFTPFLGTELSDLPKNLTPLFDAVKEGEPEKVQYALSQGENINEKMAGGIGLIHITAITGVMSVTEMLLRFGVNVDETCDHNLTSMFLAVHRNNYNMVGYLVSRGANPNHRDAMGRTPLHWAAAAPHERLEGGNRVKMVQMLLEQGADPSIKDQEGQTAEDLAQAAELDDIVSIFTDLRGGDEDTSAVDEEGYYT